MSAKDLKVVYHYHSGFSVQCGKTLLVFDYWTGEHNEVGSAGCITPDYLRSFDHIFVFVTHSHPDHFDPVIYTWRNEFPKITYIRASDMRIGTVGKPIGPGETKDFGGITVTAYPSTDLGVAYLVTVDGLNIFHAGDLNLWHWREESTMQQIQAAEEAFYSAIEPLKKLSIDVAMFPVDPRQGLMYDAGANHFVLTVKPRVFIPMHWQNRPEIAMDFARRSRTPVTEVLPLVTPGMTASMHFENGIIDITIYDGPKSLPAEDIPLRPAEVFDRDDPFLDSDLPVDLDS